MDGSRATAPSSAFGTQFPAGLRVLVVDDDPTCLKITEKMLHRCLYDVTTCSRAEIALSMLRERKDGFDLVLSDVYMPDMDGFKLLELIGLEMDLPVIMMSADDGKELVMKGVKHGACDYLIKPVRMEALKNIWQHVVRKRKNEFMDNDLKDLEQSGSVEDTEKPRKQLDDGDYASSASEANWKNVKRRKEEKEEDDETEEHVDSSTLKKPRVVWSIELHQQFVAAVNQLGVDKAVPKKILELMNVPGLTRENVASHLQKYRLYLRRVSASQHHSRNETHFSSMAEATYSLDRLDLQALAISGQITPQHLASYQTGPRRVANNGVSVPTTNQMNFLNCDTQIANASKIKATSVQEWNSKQMNIRSGSSADMVPRQLGQPQQVVQSYGNMGLVMNQGTSRFSDPLSSSARSSSFHGGTISGHQSNSSVMQMTQQGQRFSLSQQQTQLRMDVSKQPQSKGLLLNGIAAQHDSRFPSTIKQHILSNEISDQVYGRGGAAIIGDLSVPEAYINTSYPLVPQASYTNFQNSCMVESVGNCYPHIRTVGSSTLTSSGIFQEGTSSGNLESDTICFEEAKDLAPSYDLLNEICQGKKQDWKLQALNLPYESSQHLGSQQSNMDFGSSLLAHQDHITAINNGNSRNICTVSKVVFPVRTEMEHGKIGCIAQRNSTILLENSVRPKAESMPDLSYQEMSFAEPSIPNELLDIIGEQQEGVGQVDPEFNFDSYHLDDVLV